MAAPETVTKAPDFEPNVTNVGTVNAPKFHFELPRAIKFYYGNLLGTKAGGTVTNPLFADYGVGDYYINEPTGFIYKVTSKTNDITCVFEYQATIQQPLPNIITSAIAPYT
nr:MAG TPA: hypothetical protein [Caudoviricetes sp.]